MTRRMIIMLAATALVLGGVFGFEAFRSHMIAKVMAQQAFPPQTVSALTAHQEEWQPTVRAVGSLHAVNGADLANQVAGTVTAIHFESGADVKAGTLLVELASGDEAGKLNSLKAQAALARITYERDLKQLKAQGVSQQQVDADEQNMKSLEAQVAQQQALLDYKMIRAPFAGRLGIRMVDVGQYVAAGTPLVTLQSLDPIYADFTLPQQALEDVKVGETVTVQVDTYPGEKFAGQISAINPKIDPATRNVQIRATLKNPQQKLFPGMYGTVEIGAGAPKHYVTVPQTAVAYNSYGNMVFIVDDKGKDANGNPQLVVRQSIVQTGPTRGDQVAILSGVKDGETVVTAGQIKLRNGVPVVINNAGMAAANPAPTPVDR